MMQAEIRFWDYYVQCFGDVLMSSALTFMRDENKALFSLLSSLLTRYRIVLVNEIGVSRRWSGTKQKKKKILAKTPVQVHICLQSHKENTVSGTGEITIAMGNGPYARDRLCFVRHTFQHIQMVFYKIHRITTKSKKKPDIDVFMEVLSYDFIK